MCVDEPDVAAAGDAEVGVARLPRSVHRAPHDGDLERLRVRAQPILDHARETLDADVVAPAGRARDHHRPALTETERLEDLPRDLDLLDRVGGEGDAHRVADPVREERSDADRALDRPGELRARLGDAEVQRVRDLRREHPVRADHRRHVRRLDRDLEVAVLEPLEELDLLEGGGDERLGLILLRERMEMLRQRAGVRADTHRDPRLLRRAHDLLDLVGPADVPRVDPDRSDTGVDRLQRERGVEVDVRDDGKRREADDERQGGSVLVLRHGDPDDFAARRCERGDLRRRRRHVVRLRERHRLHDDGRAAPDEDVTDADLDVARHA